MNREEAEKAIHILLQYIGEDSNREGLKDTPARVIRAYDEYTKGYKEDPKDHLKVTFEDVYDEIITVKDIPFTSLCEHHLAPIVGFATIAYQPKGRIVGLSKLARLVDIYAKRLQVQERMTREIAESFYKIVEPSGVFVQLVAEHHCMTARGVKKPGALMTTSFGLGSLRKNHLFKDGF